MGPGGLSGLLREMLKKKGAGTEKTIRIYRNLYHPNLQTAHMIVHLWLRKQDRREGRKSQNTRKSGVKWSLLEMAAQTRL